VHTTQDNSDATKYSLPKNEILIWFINKVRKSSYLMTQSSSVRCITLKWYHYTKKITFSQCCNLETKVSKHEYTREGLDLRIKTLVQRSRSQPWDLAATLFIEWDWDLAYYITLKGVLITENLEHSVVVLRPRSLETRVHSSSLSQGLGLGFEALTPRSSWVCLEIFKRVLSQQNCIFHLMKWANAKTNTAWKGITDMFKLTDKSI